MRLDWGTIKFPQNRANERVVMDTERAINGHMMIAGITGAGKTHQIRRIISEMAQQDPEVRFHVLDPHQDLDIDGASTCQFSESSPYGVNPLRIDSDPEMGGVRRRGRTFINALNRTSTKLGSKQESALYNMFVDLCAHMGFYLHDPQTWSLKHDPRANPAETKRHPTITDLRQYAEVRLKQLTTGAGGEALKQLELLNKEVKKLRTAAEKQDENKVEDRRAKVLDAFQGFVTNIETGDELPEFIKSQGRDVIQSVYDRISNLENAGVFRPAKPEFDRNASVWRYDISALPRDEQCLMVDFVMSELFAAARRRGHSTQPKTYFVLDEAHAFVSDESDHIINIIAKEGRKFGVGMILASQSFSDYPEDVIANTGTKVILGIDESYHDRVARRLGIETKRLRYIQPRKTALVQVKDAGATSNLYYETYLPTEPIAHAA